MNKHMKCSIIWYMVVVGLSAIIFLGAVFSGGSSVFKKRTVDIYQRISGLKEKSVEDPNAPIGIRYEYTKLLEKMPPQDSGIVFCAIHQNVSVYLNDELVYEVKQNSASHFIGSPGTNWVIVPIYQTDKGKTLKIIMTPAYKAVAGVKPDVYYGSPTEITLAMIKRQIFPFILCALTFVLAMVFIVLGAWNYQNTKSGIDLVIIGFFALILSIWRCCDLNVVKFFMDNKCAVACAALIAVSFLSPTFIVYSKCLFHERDHMIWYIMEYISLGAVSLSSILQLLGIADLRQTLFIQHIVMCMTVCGIVFMIYREIKEYGFATNIRLTVAGISICLVGLVGDMISYYKTKGASFTSWGMIGFIIYIILLGIVSFYNTRRILNIARQAQHYEKMAYHDELTGLYNRAAYADNTGIGFVPEGHIIVMCDLNNLKKCNDSFGHEQGDLYIKSSAELLEAIFGKYGKCYRMGGDEFTMVLKNLSLESVRIKEDIIADRCRSYNEEHPDRFPMNIACGYAMFDPDEDTDISDTVRRADKMMYIHKFMMKGELGR